MAMFRVADTSMQPALRHGDRVLVARWPAPRVGDMVVVRDPESGSRFLVKRLRARTARGELVLSGDNPNVSRDSRLFGALPRGLLVGKVVWRYRPRSGRP